MLSSACIHAVALTVVVSCTVLCHAVVSYRYRVASCHPRMLWVPRRLAPARRWRSASRLCIVCWRCGGPSA